MKKSSFLLWMFLFTIISKRLNISFLGINNFDFYAYPVFIILFLRYFKLSKNEFNKFLIIIILFFIWEYTLKYYLNFSYILFLKQAVPIIIIYTASYIIMEKFNISKLFLNYSKMMYYLSVFALLQFTLAMFNVFTLGNEGLIVFKIGVVNITRVTSVLPEPSHFSVVVLPAFFYYILSKGLLVRRTLVIGAALFLTFSATAFMAIMVGFLLILFKKKKAILQKVFIVLVAIMSVFVSYSYLEDRFTESLDLDRDQLTSINMSSFSFLSNIEVAKFSLFTSPLFGVGLGGHEEMYEKVFSGTDIESFRGYKLNYNSAHSLMIRIVSETGLIGVVLLFLFFYKYRIKLDTRNIYSIISFASLIYFVSRVFKLGGYFDYGIYFFFWSYYFSYITNRRENKMFIIKV